MIVLKRSHQKSQNGDFWIGFSDLMTGLMLVFIILSLTFMAIAKKKLDEVQDNKKNIIVILSEKLASENIKVEYNAEKGTVTIAQDILFDQKAASLNTEGKAFITLFSNILNENILSKKEYSHLVKFVHIEGYASREGSEVYNFSLSFERAMNVWLSMTQNVKENRLMMKQKLNIVSRGEIEAEQNFTKDSDRKVMFRFEFYDVYNKIFEGLSSS
jgi:outer membrane protein OmpA-like peptidoglycan-associated protein